MYIVKLKKCGYEWYIKEYGIFVGDVKEAMLFKTKDGAEGCVLRVAKNIQPFCFIEKATSPISDIFTLEFLSDKRR